MGGEEEKGEDGGRGFFLKALNGITESRADSCDTLLHKHRAAGSL